MTDATGSILACAQILLLGFTAIGWGLWIARIARGNLRVKLADQALCAAAGWAACPLLLGNLVYMGVKISSSAWLALAVALSGWAQFLISRSRDEWRQWRHGIAGAGCVALLVILFQGAGLWTNGAHNYYGTAHQDQANYVQLAQFLIEKPFNTSLTQVGLEPWLVKGIDTKEVRIGQSVANAYVAVISGTDAKSAYGAVSIFSLGMMALAVFGLLRNLGLSPSGAFLAALWAGALPIVTHTQLDGFFSQTFVLGVLPALAWATLLAGRNARLAWLTGGLLLAELLNGYTEIYVIGVAIIAAGILIQYHIKLVRRIVLSVGILGVSLVAVTAYTMRCVTFVRQQYSVAGNPEALADLAPRSGTWGGWAELFFPSGVNQAQPVPQPIVLAGFLILVLALAGLASNQPGRRLWLSAIAAVPAGLCAVLLAMPVFSKYPFAKLLATFSPLIVAFAALGLWRSLPLLTLLVRHNHPRIIQSGWIRVAACLLTFGLILVAGWASAPMLASVVRNEGILTIVNSPQTRALYHELEEHPGRTYLLNEQHNILNAWLAYHARHSQLYTDVDFIGDRPTPSSQFNFRRPPAGQALALLNRNGIKSVGISHSAPDILVRNPQGIEGSQDLTFYWIGDSASVEFYQFSPTTEDFVFTLRCLAGPANPSPYRTVALVSNLPGSEPMIQTFDLDSKLSFSLRLHPGQNVFTFKVIAPTDWLVHLPGDARKHMVRIQELSISSVTNHTAP